MNSKARIEQILEREKNKEGNISQISKSINSQRRVFFDEKKIKFPSEGQNKLLINFITSKYQIFGMISLILALLEIFLGVILVLLGEGLF